MIIRIRTRLGTYKINLPDDPTNSLRTLKEAIEKEVSIPICMVSLALDLQGSNRIICDDETRLLDAGIVHGDLLYICDRLATEDGIVSTSNHDNASIHTLVDNGNIHISDENMLQTDADSNSIDQIYPGGIDRKNCNDVDDNLLEYQHEEANDNECYSEYDDADNISGWNNESGGVRSADPSQRMTLQREWMPDEVCVCKYL